MKIAQKHPLTHKHTSHRIKTCVDYFDISHCINMIIFLPLSLSCVFNLHFDSNDPLKGVFSNPCTFNSLLISVSVNGTRLSPTLSSEFTIMAFVCLQPENICMCFLKMQSQDVHEVENEYYIFPKLMIFFPVKMKIYGVDNVAYKLLAFNKLLRISMFC